MTVEEAKAKIFHWLCSRYHDPGKGSEYIEKDTVKVCDKHSRRRF